MKAKLDLHIHSEASPDGRMSLDTVVARARKAGLQGVAICDHDVLYRGEREKEGLLVIPGEEFSTEYGHLLGLFLSEPVEKGSFEETVERIHAQGGLAVLAHPFEHRKSTGEIEPVAGLLDGVETWNGRANRKNRLANAMAYRFAEDHGLPGFGGSDAHVAREIGNGTVTVEVEELTAEAVKAALLRPGNAVTGKNGLALDVARSQLTKRRKSRAALSDYAFWAAFAVTCVLHDIRWMGGR